MIRFQNAKRGMGIIYLQNMKQIGANMCLKMWKGIGHEVLENVEGGVGMIRLKM